MTLLFGDFSASLVFKPSSNNVPQLNLVPGDMEEMVVTDLKTVAHFKHLQPEKDS